VFSTLVFLFDIFVVPDYAARLPRGASIVRGACPSSCPDGWQWQQGLWGDSLGSLSKRGNNSGLPRGAKGILVDRFATNRDSFVFPRFFPYTFITHRPILLFRTTFILLCLLTNQSSNHHQIASCHGQTNSSQFKSLFHINKTNHLQITILCPHSSTLQHYSCYRHQAVAASTQQPPSCYYEL